MREKTITGLMDIYDALLKAKEKKADVKIDNNTNSLEFIHLLTSYRELEKRIEQLFKNIGIEKMDVVNKKYNGKIHDCITKICDYSIDDNIITQEIAPGYECDGVVFRKPKVVVNFLI